MNTRQASAASNPPFTPAIPPMSYSQQPTYANHPPPGAMYPVGGMPGGQQSLQYRMLTGLPSATVGHGGPLGSGPVGVGRGGAMPMTINGQPQGPGMALRYGQPQMGNGRTIPNGMVQNPLGRGMPGAVGGMPGMRMPYQPGMSLPPGARVVATAPGGIAGHPNTQYTVVNQHGQPLSFHQMPQPQQQHANPNGPGGPGQPPAHMLPQQQPGGPPQQPPPLGGPGMTHPGGQGQKLYQQQQPFMNALPPPNGGSPVRNPSPSAATPANAQTPGGPGAGRGMIKPPTPAPFPPANAPTPGARPGTASGQPNSSGYTQHTPRTPAAEAMAGVGLQSSPGAMQRNPSTNMGLHQQQQHAHLSQQGGPQPQPGGPGGPGDAMNHSAIYRTTPAQMENERNIQIYGPGQVQVPMEGVRYAPMSMGATPGQLAQQDQQRRGQMANPLQSVIVPGALQLQHTGGSMSSQAGQLAPQHTGGVRPLVAQHTGGSIQDSVMNGPGTAAGGPGGRTSVPSTPQPPSRQGSMSMSMSGGPTGMMRPGSVPSPIGSMPGVPGHPMGAEMAPPPPRNEGFRSLPMELAAVNANTMPHDGMIGVATSRHAFGVLRLLQFSSRMRNVSGHDTKKWSRIIAEHFTENATLSFRAERNTGRPTNSFGTLVHLPFPLIARFFATLTQSTINRMSFILDGAIESQEGQSYTVFCSTARWPMHYENGYIFELNGVLRARCKTVPVTISVPDASNSAGAPGSTPQLASAVPSTNTNGMDSSPSSSNNMHASPTSRPSNTGNSPHGPEPKPYMPMQNGLYMVKIDELSFDSENVEKLIDVGTAGNHQPREPDNIFGIPKMTMRMIEFCEGTQALERAFDFAATVPNTTLKHALEEYTIKYEQSRTQAGPPRESLAEQYVLTYLPGQPGALMKNGRAAVKEILQSGVALKGLIGYDDLNSGASPSTLSANVNQTMSELIVPSSSTSEPTVSPSLAPKTPGKKSAGPGSPTKATANGATDKDKGGGKRKSTNDAEAPPAKRRTPRKGSKAT